MPEFWAEAARIVKPGERLHCGHALQSIAVKIQFIPLMFLLKSHYVCRSIHPECGRSAEGAIPP